jgi:hypothetical protein
LDSRRRRSSGAADRSGRQRGGCAIEKERHRSVPPAFDEEVEATVLIPIGGNEGLAAIQLDGVLERSVADARREDDAARTVVSEAGEQVEDSVAVQVGSPDLPGVEDSRDAGLFPECAVAVSQKDGNRSTIDDGQVHDAVAVEIAGAHADVPPVGSSRTPPNSPSPRPSRIIVPPTE